MVPPMNCVILQPSYIPWRGFFHQIQKADVFVFHDNVQYGRTGWRNRNRVKTPSGPDWLTIPVCLHGLARQESLINEIRINWDRDWAKNHLARLLQLYAKAPLSSNTARCFRSSTQSVP